MNIKKNALLLPLATFPFSAEAITTTVPSGTTESNGEVIAVVTQQVYGETDNFKVYGTQQVMNGGLTHDSDIYSYAQQDVLSGGTAYDTNVQYYAIQNINGKAYNSTVSSRGNINLRKGGYAENTMINGGTLSVAAGGEASGTKLQSGAENVSGTDINAQISGGIQEIKSGGLAEGAQVSGRGIQKVDAGGRAQNTVLTGRGTQQVYGTAIKTQINDDASMTVYDGGHAEQTVINGGEMEVEEEASTVKTTINAGTQYVYGTDSNSIINGGEQNIAGGGKAINTQINSGGKQTVDIGGSTEGSEVAAGGTMQVLSWGSAANTLLNGGEMIVTAGAESSGTRINAGTQTVAGTDSDAVINGGTQNVQSGGHSKNATLSGGTQNIESGASANATKIINGTQNVYGTSENAQLSGGKMEIFQGGSAANVEVRDGLLVLNSGGILNGTTQISQGAMTFQGQQNISDLQLDDAVVNFARGTDFSTLQVDNLNGRGVFNMSSDLSRNEADYLEVANGSGDFGLIIHDYSADGGLPVKFSIIESAAADNNFYLVGDAVDVGAFQYGLQQEGNSWYLTKMQNLTESSIIAKNTYNSLASLFYTHINPVYQHLYSTRRDVSMQNKLWVKGIGRHLNLDYDDNSGSKVDIYGVEAGYDHNLWSNGTNTLKAGIFASYSNSRQEYDMHGHGDGNTNGLGIYSTFNFGDNWFVDAVGSYFYHRQKIKSYTPSGFDVDSKYHAEGWHASAFIGKRLNFEQNWFIEPNAGIRYMLIDNISYRTNYNTRVTASASDYFSVSAGITGGKEFQLENQGILDIYGRFNLIHDRDGKSVLQVADYSFTEDMSALQYELGGGVSFSWDEGKNAAYLDAVTLLGSTVRVPVEVQLGLRFGF